MSRVLLVDDDPAGLELRRMILARVGHEVFCALDSQQARLAFEQHRPDVVVLDLRLPDPEDGLSLIREVRTRAPHVRIIVLCGHPPDIERKAEVKMVNGILGKPVRTETLIAVIAGDS
jgi:DNA-binding response OmpR family regulator